MPTDHTILVNTRITPRLKAAVQRQANRDSLSFSDVSRVLLNAYAQGDITIEVSAKQKGQVRA